MDLCPPPSPLSLAFVLAPPSFPVQAAFRLEMVCKLLTVAGYFIEVIEPNTVASVIQTLQRLVVGHEMRIQLLFMNLWELYALQRWLPRSLRQQSPEKGRITPAPMKAALVLPFCILLSISKFQLNCACCGFSFSRTFRCHPLLKWWLKECMSTTRIHGKIVVELC